MFKKRPKPIASIWQYGSHFAIEIPVAYASSFLANPALPGTMRGETFMAKENIHKHCLFLSIEDAIYEHSIITGKKVKDIF
jgi:hypothetical protein